MADMESLHTRKVRKIFAHFDLNQDGRLSREEMGALVVAVNPRVRFTEHHVKEILDEVFRTYSDFIDGSAGLSFEGLLRTYEDGAGDVDRDFSALKLSLDDNGNDASSKAAAASSIVDERGDNAPLVRRREHMPSWAPSNIAFDSSWLLVEDLLIIIKRLETKMADKLREGKTFGSTDGSSEVPWSNDLSVTLGSGGSGCRPWEELGQDYANFCKELSDIVQKANKLGSPDEVFDAHLAIGRALFDHVLHKEAMASLKKAVELKATDVRPHFHLGNALYCLGKNAEAIESYSAALRLVSDKQSLPVLPFLHVNLGIALEGEGMLLSAAEHYKEAAKLSPKNHRAFKLLGSALYGIGDFRVAENALREAIALKPDFADAHCDLGSTLHALGEDNEGAIHEFQKALDLKPDHMEALYNLGGLFKDIGRFQRAAEMYSKVLALQPGHWRAQLNRAVALLGAGEREEANKAFKEAFKMTNRVELYDAVMHMKLMGKKPKGLGTALKGAEEGTTDVEAGVTNSRDVGVLVVEPSRFRRASDKTTPRPWLSTALDIRRFQRDTRLGRCEVVNLGKEFMDNKEQTAGNTALHMAPKHELEKILSRLLPFLKPDTFQGTVKAINKKVLNVLDQASSGQIDLGIFFAVIAPICAGSQDQRKKAAFDALAWRSSRGNSAEIPKTDASYYTRVLRAVYLPKQGVSDIMELHGEDDQSTMSFSQFQKLFDDPDWGFGILDVLVKLEASDRVRHRSQTCAVCAYPITGPWFKEVTVNFSLCCLCYSEGKVPSSGKQAEYCFKEYNSEVEAVKDKLRFFSSRSSNTSSAA
ncbi:hypothetical protein GOP47_0021282 [Adiantum capillus-veneris]|uniref:EF-hand domain-containing protein n=1 Tax=Adiantum capillus-veneris TaxID=13818 RepID=A0A9D4Z8I0_ADICA|nr:hypothetical protein GOP47_0021282 [Adiantum capillus-veneris]